MKHYKFTLAPNSKKFICPNCEKRTFVKYIDNDTQNYLDEHFGRCDRESSCGYFRRPNAEMTSCFKMEKEMPLKASYHGLELIEKTFKVNYENSFIKFLQTIFAEKQVEEAVNKYLIGTSKRWAGATIFWQIDNLERVHSGKILSYNATSGKRMKNSDGRAEIDWVHSILKKRKVIKEFNLIQCLFGLHLINKVEKNILALVESEKTAVIMSIFKPEYIWLATGSKAGLKYEFLKIIKNYKIIAFPDKSEFNDWLSKAKKLNLMGFDITVNDWLETTNYEAGTDLADVYCSFKVENLSR